jgi:hypothetical protein
MNQSFRFFVPILLVAAISACAPGILATREVPATPTSPVRATATTAVTEEGYYPLTTRTGIGTLDAIVDAAASGDMAMLKPLIHFTDAKCTLAEGLGGPPKCRAGEAEGTSMEVLPFLGSEGSYLRRSEIDSWQGIDVSGLYAVYEVSTDLVVEEYFPVGQYAIVFAGGGIEPGTILRIADGQIVRIDSLYDASPEALNALLAREASRIILAPPAQ